jgi:hypothetical protein
MRRYLAGVGNENQENNNDSNLKKPARQCGRKILPIRTKLDYAFVSVIEESITSTIKVITGSPGSDGPC